MSDAKTKAIEEVLVYLHEKKPVSIEEIHKELINGLSMVWDASRVVALREAEKIIVLHDDCEYDGYCDKIEGNWRCITKITEDMLKCAGGGG